MAEIHPFRGYRYNPVQINDPSSLFVPPYDVISPKQLAAFRKTNPYNYIHLTLSKPTQDDKPYQPVRRKLQAWIKKQVMIQDELPAIYFYTLDYSVDSDIALIPGRKKIKKSLSGFISLVKVESYESGMVIPHEVTFPTPRLDRMQLLSDTEAHLEPVYCLYEDRKMTIQTLLKSAVQGKPDIRLKDGNGTLHRFWKIDDPVVLKLLQKSMKNKSLLIADGHHRYGAALEYRDKLKHENPAIPDTHPSNYIMMFLANMDDSDLFIAPTHRLVKSTNNLDNLSLMDKLGVDFKIISSPMKTQLKSRSWLIDEMNKYKPSQNVIGFYDGNYHLLVYKKDVKSENKLDTEIVRDKIIQEIFDLNKSEQLYKNTGYSHSYSEALEKIDKGDFEYAFILRTPDIHDVKKICAAGRMMPQKSTYFYPKPLSGLVVSVF